MHHDTEIIKLVQNNCNNFEEQKINKPCILTALYTVHELDPRFKLYISRP